MRHDIWEFKEIDLHIRYDDSEEVIYSFKAKVRKCTVSEYRNGYSNWDGKVHFDAYEIEFTRPCGEVVNIKDHRRKDVIFEAILREANRLNLKNVFALNRKGKK